MNEIALLLMSIDNLMGRLSSFSSKTRSVKTHTTVCRVPTMDTFYSPFQIDQFNETQTQKRQSSTHSGAEG